MFENGDHIKRNVSRDDLQDFSELGKAILSDMKSVVENRWKDPTHEDTSYENIMIVPAVLWASMTMAVVTIVEVMEDKQSREKSIQDLHHLLDEAAKGYFRHLDKKANDG